MYPDISQHFIYMLKSLIGMSGCSKFGTNQNNTVKTTFLQIIYHLLMFFPTCFTQFLHIAKNHHLMRSFYLTEILQGSHHTGRVGIICIHNQFIIGCFFQLRPVIVRQIRRQRTADIVIGHSKVTSDSCCCQHIIQII